MVERSKWRNDRPPFNINDRVIIFTDKNTNSALKMDPLYTKIDYTVYVVTGFEGNLVLIEDKNNLVLKIPFERLTKIE